MRHVYFTLLLIVEGFLPLLILYLIIEKLPAFLSDRPLHLVLQLFSCHSISKHILLVPSNDLLLGHLPLDVRYDHLLVVLIHHLVPALLELVISIAESFLLNQLSLSVLGHMPPVLVLLHCFNSLLQVSCLVIYCTGHSVMLSD